MSDLSASIKEFILTEVNPELNLRSLDDDEPLIETGIVDSLGILKIMSFLDESHGVDLSSAEVNLENFQNVRSIIELVRQQEGS